MKIILSLIVALLAVPTLRAQEAPDASTTAQADALRAAGDLRGAVEAYYGAYYQAGATGGDTAAIAYAIASTYALSGAFPDSAFTWLDRALVTNASPKPLYDPDLFFLVDDPRWAAVESRLLDRLAESVGEGFDRDYARTLLATRMNEWGYRWHIMYAFRTLGPDSPILTALSHAMQEHHAENEKVVFGLLDSRGWPARSAVGEDAAFAAANVLTHADLTTRQRYLPMLEAACEAGEADWNDYAPVFDRTELELGRPQVYGTQMEMDEASGDYVPQRLVDPDHVDERRAAKGMEPIADQLARFNAAMKRDFGG